MKRFSLLLLAVISVAGPISAQQVDMNNLPQDTIRIVNGTDPVYYGLTVHNINDFNGDGLDDFALAAPYSNVVYVIYGKRSYPPQLNLFNLGPNGFAIYGGSDTGFGFSVGSPGDMNRDGKADLVIGAPYEGDGGRIYVLKGSFNYQDIFISDEDKFLLILEGAPGEFLGQYLGMGGLIDGDSSADILIPSPDRVYTQNDQSFQGAAYIIYGQIEFSSQILNTESLDPETTTTFLNTASQDDDIFVSGFGRILEPVGDMNGEGSQDVILLTGYRFTDPSEARFAVFPGEQNLKGVFDLNSLSFPVHSIVLQLFPVISIDDINQLCAWDINQDGAKELLVSFPSMSLNEETLGAGVIAIIPSSTDWDQEQVITLEDPSAILLSLPQPNASLGAKFVCTSDQLIVGAPGANEPNQNTIDQGALFLIPWKNMTIPGTYPDAATVANTVFYGKETGDLFAVTFDLLNDLNRDGVDEIVIGTQEAGTNVTAAYLVPSQPVITGIQDFMLYE